MESLNFGVVVWMWYPYLIFCGCVGVDTEASVVSCCIHFHFHSFHVVQAGARWSWDVYYRQTIDGIQTQSVLTGDGLLELCQ